MDQEWVLECNNEAERDFLDAWIFDLPKSPSRGEGKLSVL
jgi:hypothetical protein